MLKVLSLLNKERAMRFTHVHFMPYTGVTKKSYDWPVANKQFDGKIGTALWKEYIEDKVYAEECGFDYISSNEHHYSPYGMMPNPNLVGAIVSDRTSSAKIVQTGNLIPILNPIRVAEEYAMLDVASGGRLVAGFMRGIPHEYVAYNVSADESYERMEEGVELILKCWTEPEPFGWEGKYYQFRAVSVWPKPIQRPHPPILMSVQSERSTKIAARFKAIAGILALTSFDEARETMDRYRMFARQEGWEPTNEHFTSGSTCCIAPTYEEAKSHLEPAMEYFFGTLGGGIRTAQKIVVQKTRFWGSKEEAKTFASRAVNMRQGGLSFDERVDRGLIICGTPEMAIKQIERFHKELGIVNMSLNVNVGNMPREVGRRTMEYLRDIVFPAVKHLGVTYQAAE